MFFRRRSEPAKVLWTAQRGRIALSLETRFTVSDHFDGFIDESTGSSLVLVELPQGAFGESENITNAIQTFGAQGITNMSRLRLKRRAGPYVCLRGDHVTPLVDYVKYILLFPGPDVTALITMNVPRAALASGLLTGDGIEETLASAAIVPAATSTTLRGSSPRSGGAAFSLGYLGPFERDNSVMGPVQAFRMKSRQDTPGFSPMFLVSAQLAVAGIPNLELFSEKSFHDIDQITGKSIYEAQAYEIVGHSSFEIVGGGAFGATGDPALAFQVVIDGRHGGYYRLLGLAPASERAWFVGELRQVARNLKPLD